MFSIKKLLFLSLLISNFGFASEKVAPESSWGAALIYSQEDANFLYGGLAAIGESHWRIIESLNETSLKNDEVMVLIKMKVELTTEGLWLNRLLESAQKQVESLSVISQPLESTMEYHEEIEFAIPVKKAWVSESSCEYGILTLVFDDNNEVSKFDGACIIVK